MQLSVLRSRIEEQVGISASLSGQSARYNSWINETYKILASEANWPWLIKNDVIQTSADITSLTSTISVGSASLTLSAAPSESGSDISIANDWRVQFSDSDDWYDVSSHTASTTAVTLADNFIGASALSAASTTIRKAYYSLPSDFDRMLVVTEARDRTPLRYMDFRDYKKKFPDTDDTGTPYSYHIKGLDSSDNFRIGFFPIPDSRQNVDIWYLKSITELSADTDTPIFPAKWHQILVHGALAFFGWDYTDDTRQANAERKYRVMLQDMKDRLLPSVDKHARISRWDEALGVQGVLPPRFPPKYGVPF